MKRLSKIISLFFMVSFLIGINLSIAEEKNYKIVKLVNDKVITSYDLEQRVKLFAIINQVNIDQNNYKGIASKVLNNIIDELLQLEKIQEYKIIVSEKEVNNYLQRMYNNNDSNVNELFNVLKENKINSNILKDYIKVQIAWQDLTARLYYRSSNVNEDDLIKYLQDNPTSSKEDATNIMLQNQIQLRAKKYLRDIRSEANIENR